MSVNKNCMFALALREGESTHISAIDKFQFWNSSFTLTMSFFQTGESDEVVLFNQEGIMKVGFCNSIFYVKIADKEFHSEEGRMVVLPKVWNSISIAYDISSKIVSAYINGIKDFEAELSLEGELPVFDSAGDYVLGEKFNGYFKKVFCYAGIHTEEEMFQISNIDPVVASEHEFYLDFSAKEPKDIGKYGKNIFTTCFAFNKNIIPTIDFGESGYICSEGSEEVLSDDYTENDFTIVSKIYISDSRSSHILFAKENESCNGFFIGVFCTDGNPRLFFKNGETNVAIDRTLPLYTWLDLAFVCSNKRIQVFCDGEEFGECELPGELAFSSNKFTIGNAATQSSYKSFCGYIDYVAVFNGVKAKEELKKYISDIPYIYSKDISALYYLSDVNAVELINSKKIIINESVCCFAEDTQRVETDMLTYDNECENEISISRYDQWQGSLAAGLFLGSISSMGIRHRFGLDSNGMPTQSVAREFTKRVSSIPEHMEICLNSTSITPAMTQSYLSALESAGILGSLGTLFGISSFEVDKFAIAILGAAAIGACSVLIATACEKGSDIILNNDNKEPPEQDPEDEKTVVYLKSITFAHNPQDKSSAVYLRRSENQNSSEWELGQTDATDALYIADRHENVSVKATIVFNKPFVGTILAKAVKTDDGILGDLEETKITIDAPTYPAEVEVSLKLARDNFHDVKLGSYIDNLTWAARTEKGQTILDTSSHRTWILETEPLEQWNILEKDEAKNISVDTLKILDEIRKYDSSKEAGCKLSLTDTDSWLKQMLHFVYDSGVFSYNYEKCISYSRHDIIESSYCFDIRKFEKNYFLVKEYCLELSSLDASMTIKTMMSLAGYIVNIAYIHSKGNNETVIDEIKNTIYIDEVDISFENVGVINCDEVECFSISGKHYVLMVKKQEDIYIYDATLCLKLKKENDEKFQSIYLHQIPFTQSEFQDDEFCSFKNEAYYREAIIPVGSSAFCSNEEKTWELQVVQSKLKRLTKINHHENIIVPQVGEIIEVDNRFVFSARNEQFNSSLKKKIIPTSQSYEIIAHKVSYDFIVKVLIEITNMLFYVDDKSQEAQYFEYLAYLLGELIFGDSESPLLTSTEEADKDSKKMYTDKIDRLYKEIVFSKKTAKDCLSLFREIITLATMSSYFNLKAGNNRWNSSIGSGFDTENNWKLIVNSTWGGTQYLCQNGDIYKSSIPGKASSIELYLTDVDAYRLRIIIEIGKYIDVSLPYPRLYKNKKWLTNEYMISCSNTRVPFDDWLSSKRVEIYNFALLDWEGKSIVTYNEMMEEIE